MLVLIKSLLSSNSCGVGQHLPGQAVVAHEPRPGAGAVGLLGLDEALDEGGDGLADRAVGDPVEGGAHGPLVGARVRQAQQVAVRPAPAVAVLDRLVGEPIDRAGGVPGADGAAQAPPPAAELLDVVGEGEQVRSGAGDLRQRAW